MRDIKLRARLSAYSKIESIQGLNQSLPDPDVIGPGSSVVVSPEGNYVPMTPVTDSQIDQLFQDVNDPSAVTKDEIDTLFPAEESSKETVTFADIDSLFE